MTSLLTLALTTTLTVPTFGRVNLYQSSGTPERVVLFVSGDAGWTGDVTAMAERLRGLGALVVGIDLRSLRRGLEQSESCTYPAGDFEELSRNIQLHLRLPAYQRPLLVGYQSGAALVYAALASAPAETFAGAISLGFCRDFAIRLPLCERRGLKTTRMQTTSRAGRVYRLHPDPSLTPSWIVVRGERDRACPAADVQAFVRATTSARLVTADDITTSLVDAYRALAPKPAADSPLATVPEVADLSVIEVPATSASNRDLMAVLLTGDGGWAELDKSVAAGLAAEGVPTIGWSTLRYFWSAKTPEQAASDLARIIGHYTSAWHKSRVTLIGYSFGADVLPFLVTRLPPASKNHVDGVTLLGLSPTASFEFHVSDWFGGTKATEYRTAPEVEKLSVPVTCVRGEGENDSGCSSLRGPQISNVVVGDGHHFGGEYQRLVDIISRRR